MYSLQILDVDEACDLRLCFMNLRGEGKEDRSVLAEENEFQKEK